MPEFSCTREQYREYLRVHAPHLLSSEEDPMAQHIDEIKREDGSVELKIRYDDPKEAPNYGEQGEAIESGHGKDAVVCKLSEVVDFNNAREVVACLMGRATATLPPGTVFEIRGKIPTNYGRVRGYAWYTCAAMQSAPLEHYIPPPGRTNDLGGYTYLGRFRT